LGYPCTLRALSAAAALDGDLGADLGGNPNSAVKEYSSKASRAGVLCNPFARPSQWLFDLLHEVDHAADAPDEAERTIIDIDDNDTTDPEARANEFAADLVLSGRAEALAMACAEAAHGSVESLKRAVSRVARDAGVDVGVLAQLSRLPALLPGRA
jgi:hypothetical protein